MGDPFKKYSLYQWDFTEHLPAIRALGKRFSMDAVGLEYLGTPRGLWPGYYDAVLNEIDPPFRVHKTLMMLAG